MKNSLGKRLLSLLLVAIMVLGLLPAIATPKAEAAEDNYDEGSKDTRDATQQSYIDIPIEVLDFRGDGFLFESQSCFTTPYDLSSSSDTINRMTRPGIKVDGDDTGRSDDFCITGLVEDELYNDNVVYKDEVIEYIAIALDNKVDIKNVDSNSTSLGNMNRIFARKVKNGNMELGDLGSTIQKADPPVKGGVLRWEDVETCFDMAYYMLFSIWREVDRTDVLGQETRIDKTVTDVHYNIAVPEVNHLRLNYINDKEYAFNSSYQTEYKDGYIYNTSTQTHSISPRFRPLNGLGFEDPNFFGNNTEGRTGLNTTESQANYSFSIHAYGGFVYSESAGYYFQFDGDDDVYFFINGQLVCDIGGIHGEMSKGIELNDYAAKLNLKDGQICTFDMFYAERHTSGINMEFYTNIRLMDTDVITDKNQHEAATGKKLVDGAAVNIGTETDYSFSILNRRQFPVEDVSFDDPAIGVTLSKDNINLNSKTALSDLSVTYRAYNRNKGLTYEGVATEVTSLTELNALLAPFFYPNNTTSMEGCAFTYRFKAGDSLADLQSLLALGIPANCELTVYGFNRTVTAGLFTNTMTSSCIPLVPQIDENQNAEFVRQVAIPGTASCRIYGVDLGTVSVTDSREFVIDYGKPIDIPMGPTLSAVSCDSGMTAEFIGLTLNGENGAVKSEAPTFLFGTSAVPSATGEQGTFNLSGETLTYQPETFLFTVEECYAVFLLRAKSDNAPIAYIYSEIRIVPANRVYYEAEDFADEITLTQKTTDSNTGTATVNNAWEVKGTSLGSTQTLSGEDNAYRIPDYSNREDVLFFGFDDTDADAQRYNLPQYKGNNFDRSRWSGASHKYVNANNVTIEDGVLKIVPKIGVTREEYPGTVTHENGEKEENVPGAGSVALHPDCSNNGNLFDNANEKALEYNPSGAEVFQIRFKMKNLDTKYDANNNKTKPYIGLHIWCAGKDGEPFKTSEGKVDAARCIDNFTYDESVLNFDEFVTWTFALGNQFKDIGTVWGVRAYFGNTFGSIEGEEGYLMVDYIYIGPADSAPYVETYGYDHSYENEEELSNGASLFTLGYGVPTPAIPDPESYTQAKFSFTGTGFDLISRTGPQQGTIRVEIFNNKDCAQSNLLYTATVNNKGDMETDMEQIPVYSKHDLPHGTYWVKISVNKKIENSVLPVLNRGNEFYLDGIIVYDPIDTTEDGGTVALEAYKAHSEAYPMVREVRDILLSAKTFKEIRTGSYGSVGGALFMDYETLPEVTAPTEEGETDPPENVVDSDIVLKEPHLTLSIRTYEKIGPKNETYLSPLQAISFKLVVNSAELPERIDIGAKAIMESGALLCIETATKEGKSTGVFCRPLNSSTVQYFGIPLCEEVFAEEKINGKTCYVTYIIIRNRAAKTDETKFSSILSITDVKVAYSQEPTERKATDSGNSGSGSGNSGGNVTSGAEIQGISHGNTEAGVQSVPRRNIEAELPTDEFVPVEFMVDAGIADVAVSVLQEYSYDENELPEDEEEPEPTEPTEPTPMEELKFAGASVSLQSDLAIHYKVNETFFTEQGFTDPYVVVNDNGFQTVIREYTVENGRYSFVYKNIAPHRIGNTVTATLYANYGDTLYASESRDYSVADYCYNMLDRYGADPKYATLMTLLVDILHYGAESQKYTGYHTDNLCTARLTEEQLAWGTELTRELENHRNQTYEVVENPTVEWKGAGLNLQESVAVRFKLVTDNYEGLEVKITLEGWTITVKAEDFDYRADGAYVHFTRLNAARMSSPIYVAAFRDGVQVSNTICYSVESYAYAKQNDTTVPYLASLVKRMMCYGDSARAYIGK